MFISHISEFCHKHAKIAFAFLLIAIIIPFVFMGAMRSSGHSRRNVDVGKMYGKDIDLDEYRFQATADEETNKRVGMGFYYSQMGRPTPAPWTNYVTVFSPRNQRQNIINRMILLKRAKELGMDQVTPAELKSFITKVFTPLFGGQKFDPATYKSVVKASRLKTPTYEKIMEDTLIITRVLDNAAEGVFLTDKEVRSQYNIQNSSVEIAVNSIFSKDFAKDFKPTKKAIKAYFDTHNHDFENPAKKRLNVVEFKVKEATPAELKAYFEKNKDKYVGAQRKASQIFITFDSDAKDKAADKTAKKAEITKILKQINDKQITFMDAAKKFSKDTTSARLGGSLGWVVKNSPGMVSKPVVDKVFEMKKGEISDIVESPKGFYLIRLDEAAPSSTTPMVALDHKNEVAIPAALKLANNFRVNLRREYRYADNLNAADIFKKLATTRKLPIYTTIEFNVGQTSFTVKNGLSVSLFNSGRDPETKKMVDTITRLTAENPTPDANIKATNGSLLVCCFKSGTGPKVPKFDEALSAQSRIKTILKQKKQMAEAKKATDELYKTISEKVSNGLTPALKTALKLKDIKSYKVFGETPSGVAGATEVATIVAKTTPGQLIAKPIESTFGYDIVYVGKRTTPSDANYAKAQESFKKKLLNQLRTRKVYLAVKKLQDAAEIEFTGDKKKK